MSDENSELAAKNARIIAQLRETFSPMTERLTPEIEPALIYEPIAAVEDDEE